MREEAVGGVVFGPRIFFRFRRETDKSVLIKRHGKKKKKEIVHSTAYL